jgi:hypothetical protein
MIEAILIGFIFGSVVIVAWPYIVSLMTISVLPTLRATMPQVAHTLAEFLKMADSPITGTRVAVKGAIETFKRRVLGIRTTATVMSGNEVKLHIKTYVQNEDYSISVSESETVGSWDELPEDIRQKAFELQSRTVEKDLKDQIANALEQKLLEIEQKA